MRGRAMQGAAIGRANGAGLYRVDVGIRCSVFGVSVNISC